MSQFIFEAIGTLWQIDIEDTLSAQKEQTVLHDVMERIGVFDKAYSRFRADSLVTEMSKKAGIYTLPSDSGAMMEIYHDLYKRTGGLLTPLIGQALVDAGYDASYSLTQHKELERPLEWDDALSFTYPELTIKKTVLLDFGAAGKGYLIDLVGEVLSKHGIVNFCVDAGGDMVQRSTTGKALRIGLEDPDDFSKVIGVITLANKSLCASAGSRRKWHDFNHIINPETLTSPKEIVATWVIAKTTLIADALASCLFFVPASTLTPAYMFEYLVLHADRSVEKSAAFPAELFNV